MPSVEKQHPRYKPASSCGSTPRTWYLDASAFGTELSAKTAYQYPLRKVSPVKSGISGTLTIGFLRRTSIGGTGTKWPHERLNVGEAVAKVLGGQNMLSEASVQTLINNPTDERWYVRKVSVRILSGHVEWSEAVIMALVAAVQYENANVGEDGGRPSEIYPET
ncbi:hypothetical protein BGZ65_009156 [Modicella reniformis]|uniref:Uncharacterized protein n=1 Tax=Modicella reniformis TaxID=1440133 RepID=A0A9P6M1D1_9FUNG|nr:hypothetical protein BGZ65_009156 [Modicella reniformis]